jgi:hypothetical protein
MSDGIDKVEAAFVAGEPGANTRYWLRLIHEHRLRIEGAVENALHKIGADSGWSPDAMEMMFLRGDIGQMRRMADWMETKLKLMTKEAA